MYSTCTFCHAPLGRNEALEHFPVGRRLAFDQARGRLWVVCPSCLQWNLSPLESRWEAIEEAERSYRDTSRRVATDHIGLARLKDGTDLIRIGEPLRPEFAAWRYGERFEKRWRRHLTWMIGGGVALGGYVLAGPVFGLIAGGFSTLPINLYSVGQQAYRARLIAGKFEDEEGPITVNYTHTFQSRLVPDPETELGWAISVPRIRGPHPKGRFGKSASVFNDSRSLLRGEAAREGARLFLPMVNEKGGRRSTVAEAVSHLERYGEANEVFRRSVGLVGRDGHGDPSRDLSALPIETRLALEMAAHEDLERRALEGELAALEAQWKSAEEIAAIADNLTLPERLVERLERLGKGR